MARILVEPALTQWDSRGEAMSMDVHSDSSAPSRPLALETDLQWYAIRTRSRQEKKVYERLFGIGIEPVLPLTRELRQWSDRKVLTELPLFVGYCFAHFSLNNRRMILQLPGVAGIVGARAPEAIPLAELDAIRALSASERLVEHHDYYAEGTWVEVVKGPLIGLRGQFVRRDGHHMIVVRVNLIQQAAAIHIRADEVVPLK